MSSRRRNPAPVKDDSIYVKVPISGDAARLIRKHAEAIGSLLELGTQTGASIGELVSRGVVMCAELEADTRSLRKKLKR